MRLANQDSARAAGRNLGGARWRLESEFEEAGDSGQKARGFEPLAFNRTPPVVDRHAELHEARIQDGRRPQPGGAVQAVAN